LKPTRKLNRRKAGDVARGSSVEPPAEGEVVKEKKKPGRKKKTLRVGGPSEKPAKDPDEKDEKVVKVEDSDGKSSKKRKFS